MNLQDFDTQKCSWAILDKNKTLIIFSKNSIYNYDSLVKLQKLNEVNYFKHFIFVSKEK